MTTAQLQTASTFTNAGWDIATTGGTSSIWRIHDGQSGPLLRSFLTAAADTASKTYDGTASTASDRQTVVASGVTIKAPSQVSAARIGTGAPL